MHRFAYGARFFLTGNVLYDMITKKLVERVLIMKIMQRILAKSRDNMNNRPISITFLGDSVTQGCFEERSYDQFAVYHHQLKEMLTYLYPNVVFNMINAGIGGDSAYHAAERLERDVLSSSPDLVVVCLGLNDVSLGMDGLPRYIDALSRIFIRLQEEEIETIFMTPNMICTEVSDDETAHPVYAGKLAKLQADGTFDTYMNAAKELCYDRGVTVCDCHAKWKLLQQNGISVTRLLCNRINHPAREMHKLFAIELLRTILEN